VQKVCRLPRIGGPFVRGPLESPCAGLGVNLARIVGALELSAPEHLGVAADRGTIDRLDLEAGVGKGGLDIRFVEPLGVGIS
jgi:hypothetical protein